MRSSEQRNLIIEYLHKRTHPTSSEIYTELKKQNDKIGIATIYRNLKQLEELHHIKKIITPNDMTRYDADLSNHYHFICISCNEVIDLEEDILQGFNENLLEEKKLMITGHDLILYGNCESCQRKKKRS